MKLPYVVEGDGAGPKLVYAHGLMGTGAYQRAQLEPLVEAGWTLVTFDQRGHGGAPPVTEAAGYDPHDMGADLWEVADAAGFDRCWIGGGSMGAATSWCAARVRPDRVEGLIQAVPAFCARTHPAVFLFAALADALRDGGIGALIAALLRFAQDGGRDRSDDLFVEQLRTHDAASIECALRSVPRWVLPHVPEAFAGLPFPVVVMGWEDDPIHPIEITRDIAGSIGGDYIALDQDEVFAEPTAFGRSLVSALATASA